MSTPVLALDEIHRSYGPNLHALRGVSLELEAGEVVGLIGRNGAGKTTLIRVAAGLLKTHGGDTRVFGMDPWQQAVEVKRRLGYVAESQAVPGHMTARNLIDLHRGLYPTWDEDLERELLRRLAIDESARISTLSKGQARKAMLLCAIAHRPELLILDEPAGGLDPSSRREFLEVSIELLNEGGSTILFSSHHMSDVERIAGRVAIIEMGEKLLDVDLDDFRQDYCLAITKTLLEETVKRFESVKGFVRSRQHNGLCHAVFAREPSELRDELESALGITDVRCTRTSLEDMFIALVGMQS